MLPAELVLMFVCLKLISNSMAGTSEKIVLTEKQKLHTLRAKKKQLKAALCNPYCVVWPQVSNEDSAHVLKLLEREFSAIELRKPSWILRQDHVSDYKSFKKLKPAEKKEKLESLEKERTKEELNLRSQLVIGFQKVNKCLEKDELRLVLVDRGSWLLVQHLALLSAVRKCPGMALTGLNQCTAGKLGVSRVSAIGFRKQRDGDSERFHTLITDIVARCPSLNVPWMELENELLQMKSESNITSDKTESQQPSKCTEPDVEQQQTNKLKSVDVESHSLSEERLADSSKPSVLQEHGDIIHSGCSEESMEIEKDYSHLYQYKSQTQKKQKIMFVERGDGEHIEVKYDGIDNLDFVAIDDVASDVTKKKRKRKKAKMSRSSTWQPADIGQVIPNPKRKLTEQN